MLIEEPTQTQESVQVLPLSTPGILDLPELVGVRMSDPNMHQMAKGVYWGALG